MTLSTDFGGWRRGCHGEITGVVSTNGVLTPFSQLAEPLAQYSVDQNGIATGLISPSGNIPLPLTNTRKRFIFVGDSLTSGRNVNTFSTELPVLYLQSEPQILLTGTTSFTLAIRVGADAASGTGVMGFRNFRIEACNGPVYP